jgi:hypothetical protein
VGAVRVIGIGATLCALLQAPACAGDLTREGGRILHRRLGLSVEDPSRWETGWRPLAVDGADLAFAGPHGATLSLLAKCGGDAGSELPALAHALLLGLDARDVLAESAVTAGGAPAWMQTARGELDGRTVQVKSVTRRAGADCTVDLLLVTPGALAELEPDFDRWWGSLRDAAAGAEGAS